MKLLIAITVLFVAINAWVIVHEKVVVFNFAPYKTPLATLKKCWMWIKEKLVKFLKN
jgi:hypothetical protein